MSGRESRQSPKNVLISEAIRCAKSIDLDSLASIIVTMGLLYYQGNHSKVASRVTQAIKLSLTTEEYIAYLEEKNKRYETVLNNVFSQQKQS